MRRLLPLAKNPWLLASAGSLLAYALLGFLLIPLLVEHYTPPLVAEKLQRQARIGAAHFNPFLLSFEVEDFELKEADGQPIFGLRHLLVNFELESLFRQAWIFGDLVVEGAKLNVVMDDAGRTNLAKIGDALPPSEEPPQPSPPPRLLLKHLALKEGELDYTRKALTETLSPLNLELNEISTLPDSNGLLELDAQWEGGGTLHWDGRFSLEPIQAEGDFRLEGLGLASAWTFIHDRLNLAEPGGSLGLSAHYRFALPPDGTELKLSQLGFSLSKLQLALANPPAPLLALESLKLEQAEFDLAARSLKLPTLAIHKGQVKTQVDAQGATNWEGIVKPEAPATAPPAPAPAPEPAAESPWRVELGAVKLAEIAVEYADAGSQVPYAARVGRADLDFAATLETGAGEPSVGVHGIQLALHDIAIAETGPAAAPEPLLSLSKLRVEGAEFDLGGHSLKLPVWHIEKGLLRLAIDEQGGVNWQHLAKPDAPSKKSSEPAKDKAAAPSPAWKLELGSFKLAELGIRFADASRKQPFLASIDGLGLDFSAKAELGADEPKGAAEGIALSLNGIHIGEHPNTPPLLGFDSLAVQGGRLDLDKHELGIDKISLKGGGTRILRKADGSLNLVELFAPKPGAKTEPPPPAAKPPAGPAWHLGLKTFALQGFRLGFADQGFEPHLAYDTEGLDINLSNLSYPGDSPFHYEAKLALKQGGTLAVTGQASTDGDSVDASIKADRLNLTPLQPVLEPFALLKLESADFSSNLQASLRLGESGPAVKATGNLGLGGLMLKETHGGGRLLSWKSLAVNGIDFALKPDRLNIKEVRIQEPGVKFVIAKDKSNNFAAVLKTPPAPKAAPAKAEPDKKAKPAKASSPDKPFPVTLERVRLNDGVIDFGDLSLVIPFSTRVHDFDGLATDISTLPNTRTSLKFTGRVEEFGEAKVDGTLIPSAFKIFSNISVIFRNVEMSSLSPYSATFAGRKITGGKLNLDLLYKIENSELRSENKILLEQFSLGEPVESPGAVSLPLDLAIALLKDGDGRINASVPIEGNVDNPSFAIGPLLWDAFVNIIKTAATSPFRAIGSVLGIGGGEDLGAILFAAGSDAVAPPEREKLQKLTQALAQRPKLKLGVAGGYDTKLDGEALRLLRVRQAVARQAGEDGGDADPGPLSFSDFKIQKALEELARQRGGAGFLDTVQADFQTATGKKPSRVSGLSGLFGRASEDADFYEKTYQRLAEVENLPDSELEALARRRVDAVLKDLQGQKDFDPARVAAGKIEAVSGGQDGRVPTRLELGTQE